MILEGVSIKSKVRKVEDLALTSVDSLDFDSSAAVPDTDSAIFNLLSL